MKTKSKKVTTSIITLIILIGTIFVLLTACNKSTENSTNEITTETTTELTTENISTEQPEYYNEVIEQYKKAIENDFYRDLDSNKIEEIKGKYVVESVLGSITMFNAEPKVFYDFYDIDKNGVPELFIATKDSKGYVFQDILTYADEKIYPIFGEYFAMTATNVNANGTITRYSADEESRYWNFWKFAKDGYTLIDLGSLTVKNYSIDEKTKYYKSDRADNSNAEEISKEQFNSLGIDYTGHLPKEIDEHIPSWSNINFDWKEIK